MTFSLEAARQDTPASATYIHFNNAGASFMPTPVFDAMQKHLVLEQEVGGYEAAEMAAADIANFYTAFAQLLNAEESEIAFIESATRAWDMAVFAIPFEKGDRVIVLANEYASNFLALLHLQQTRNIVIDIVDVGEAAEIPAAIEAAITPRTKAIFLTHIPSQIGIINPAEAVGDVAKKHDCFYVLDACQSAGHIPIDVKEIGCDIACGTGRKYLRGPRGTGFLYVSNRVHDTLTPPFVDLHSAAWTAHNRFEWANGARRFEAFERSIAGQIALGKAADYAIMVGLNVIEAQVCRLATILGEGLSQIGNILVHEPQARHSGIVTFTSRGRDSAQVKKYLKSQKINTSTAIAANARLDMERRGVDTLVRASLHYYNCEQEIEKFCVALQSM